MTYNSYQAPVLAISFHAQEYVTLQSPGNGCLQMLSSPPFTRLSGDVARNEVPYWTFGLCHQPDSVLHAQYVQWSTNESWQRLLAADPCN